MLLICKLIDRKIEEANRQQLTELFRTLFDKCVSQHHSDSNSTTASCRDLIECFTRDVTPNQVNKYYELFFFTTLLISKRNT